MKNFQYPQHTECHQGEGGTQLYLWRGGANNTKLVDPKVLLGWNKNKKVQVPFIFSDILILAEFLLEIIVEMPQAMTLPSADFTHLNRFEQGRLAYPQWIALHGNFLTCLDVLGSQNTCMLFYGATTFHRYTYAWHGHHICSTMV